MAAPPQRSRPLHNFTLPRLKWGNQRTLRCMKLGSGDRSFESDESGGSRERDGMIHRGFFEKSLKPIAGDESDGIEAVREKIMLDLKVAADKMNFSLLAQKEAQALNQVVRPWNLRTRRAACKAPAAETTAGGKGCVQAATSGSSPQRTEAKSSRLRSLEAATGAMTTSQSKESGDDPRPKFSVPLSRGEIEADFRAMAGIRPPRRPKKRPRIVQRDVDAIFPGLWLTEITPETYRVEDVAENE